MNKVAVNRCICSGIAALFFVQAMAAEPNYAVSGDVTVEEFHKFDWTGKFTFPDVYCIRFPIPEKAKNFRRAFFGGGAIYLADAFYTDQMNVFVAVSSVPKNQTAAEAMGKVFTNERSNEAAATKMGIGYKVTEMKTDFGPSVGVLVRNPAPGNSSGPFPLTRGFLANPQGPLRTLSVHRLFVRGHDRFELAVFQPAPKPVTDATEEEMTARLIGIANEMVTSLQKCTASIPVRVAK